MKIKKENKGIIEENEEKRKNIVKKMSCGD